MPPRGRVTGGKKLAAFLKNSKREQRKIIGKPVVISIGFLDAVIAALAATHEFGLGNNPERPAFRVGIERMKSGLVHFIVSNRLIDSRKMVVNESAALRIATWCVGVVKESYHAFTTPAEGERQLARKGGRSDPLVGASGPKLISHLAAAINGQRVDQ